MFDEAPSLSPKARPPGPAERWPAPSLAAYLHAALGAIEALRRRLAHRRAMRALALFEPDSVLEDVGLTREAAWREARKPLWRS